MIMGKISRLANILSLDPHSKLLKKTFRCKMPKYKSKKQILVEFEMPPDSLFGSAYFLPVLAEELNANCISYQMAPQTLFWQIKRKLYFKLSSSSNFIGKKFVYFRSINTVRKLNVTRSFPLSKEKALEYRYREIRIGDLAYDWFLAKYHEPTVHVGDPRFHLILLQFESYVDQFLDYLKSNTVVAICVSHSVYHFAIPSRIGISQDIPVYQVSLESIFYLNSDNQIAYEGEKFFPKAFKKISREIQEVGIAKAKTRLEQRTSGIAGIDMPYMTESAFALSGKNHSVVTGKNPVKILVASHDFYDSPHVFGDFFYPDFLEWIYALIRISKNCNYEWYIKTHPFLRGSGREILQKAIYETSDFTLLPQSMSHPEIIDLGITHALTVYGSIAHEYPILGIPVINASRNNPHRAYTFSFTPISREEYEGILLDIKNFSYEIDKREIYEFYFMKHIFQGKSWLISDYERYVLETGFPQIQVSREVFFYFFKEDLVFPEVEIRERIIKFIRNQNYMVEQPI
jgi:hypothetical protein